MAVKGNVKLIKHDISHHLPISQGAWDWGTGGAFQREHKCSVCGRVIPIKSQVKVITSQVVVCKECYNQPMGGCGQ